MKKTYNHIDSHLNCPALLRTISELSIETKLNMDLLNISTKKFIPHDLIVECGSYLTLSPVSFLNQKNLVDRFISIYNKSSAAYLSAIFGVDKYTVYNARNKIMNTNDLVISAGWGISLISLLDVDSIKIARMVYQKFNIDISTLTDVQGLII
jgi:hypothetical protein